MRGSRGWCASPPTASGSTWARRPTESQASVDAELWVHPIGRASLLESAHTFPSLRVAETAGHANAVVQAEIVVDAGLDDIAGPRRGSPALRRGPAMSSSPASTTISACTT